MCWRVADVRCDQTEFHRSLHLHEYQEAPAPGDVSRHGSRAHAVRYLQWTRQRTPRCHVKNETDPLHWFDAMSLLMALHQSAQQTNP